MGVMETIKCRNCGCEFEDLHDAEPQRFYCSYMCFRGSLKRCPPAEFGNNAVWVVEADASGENVANVTQVWPEVIDTPDSNGTDRRNPDFQSAEPSR